MFTIQEVDARKQEVLRTAHAWVDGVNATHTAGDTDARRALLSAAIAYGVAADDYTRQGVTDDTL
jgi:hypothetical protein